MKEEVTLLEKLFNNRIIKHILFWLGVLILQSQLFLYTGRSFYDSLVITLALFPSILLAAYLLNYYQIPKLALQKKYLLFAISLAFSAYLFTVFARIINVYIIEPFLGIEEGRPSLDFILFILRALDRLTRNYLVSIYLAPVIMAVIKLVKQQSKEKIRIERLEREKTTTELNFLKAQIHPHFLLNTLNNIYALTIKKSDQAPDSVLKLSEMLTYVLYRCNDKYVTLNNEIQLLENYISLEKLRYRDNLKIAFQKEVTQPEQIKIAPLILMSLVENSFKHGVSGDIENPEILISLKASTIQLEFSIFNTKNATKQLDSNDYTKGIGSKNTRKQLDLIYPNNYTYTISETPTTYTVDLTINLAN